LTPAFVMRVSTDHYDQNKKNLLYRHSCQLCRVSDAREQESAVSLNVNLFLSGLGFRFTTSQIPCYA
ncbi:MAG: hypothetical protein MJA30_36490, partial [Cytophagales bacterium]|nr:hypothetical protein [Cytophagales bacterium]